MNTSDTSLFATTNSAVFFDPQHPPDAAKPRVYALALAVIPMMTVFGNALVILAVHREKSLKTVTNYLIVSLAVSDFLVAFCVMSFAVYFEYNGFVWGLGSALCKLYIGADVACSTASILNLLAISLDRYIAISHPIAYAQYGAKGGRALISIFLVWFVSITVSMPIFMGANQLEDETQTCEFTNAYFIIGSSVLSFFLPCIAMLALYTIIFRRLRQRERAKFRRTFQNNTSKHENEGISNALLNGARMAQEMGKHFKDHTDHIMLEISSQVETSSCPTVSSSEAGTYSADDQYFDHDKSNNKPKSDCTTNLESSDGKAEENLQTCSLMRSFGEDLEDELFPFIDGPVAHTDDVAASKKLTSRLNQIKEQSYSMAPLDVLLFTKLDENLVAQYKKAEIAKKVDHLKTPNSGSTRPSKKPYTGLPVSKSMDVSLNGYTGMRKSNGHGKYLVPNQQVLSVHDISKLPRHPQLKKHSKSLHHSSPKSRRLYRESTFLSLTPTRIQRDDTWVGSFRDRKNEFLKRMTSGFRGRPSRQLVKKASKQLKREHKATVTLAVVLAVFLGCWLPFFTLHTSNAVCMLRDNSGCMHIFATFFTTWLGYLNSSLNPLIYTVFDQRFRKAFRNILACPFA